MREVEVYWIGDVEEETPNKFVGKEVTEDRDRIIVKVNDTQSVYIYKKAVACVIVRKLK